ncbi:MAG: hypothetical protein ACQEVA_11600 [Myxococcota bacterium]
MHSVSRTVGLIAVLFLVGLSTSLAGSTAQTSERNPHTLVTLVLHQEASQSLPAFKEQLRENGFTDAFPPAGVEVVSWRGSLELGHVITLRLPTYKIPEVREVVENRQWGSIQPKLYTSYDFEPFWQQIGGEMNKTGRECADRRASTKRMLIAP